MSNTDAMSLPRSELNGFLFADVGIEPSGMPLSVLSALARLGMDPWQEAARLAKLPRASAVEALARLIAGMPASLWPLPDATAIAARLVALLPSGGERVGVRSAGAKRDLATTPGQRLAALVSRSGAGVPGTSQRWMLAFALLAALLSGVFMNVHPASNDQQPRRRRRPPRPARTRRCRRCGRSTNRTPNASIGFGARRRADISPESASDCVTFRNPASRCGVA